ncbi:MAG: malonate--CoA ligase [Hyphomicrobiaceae bacterium]
MTLQADQNLFTQIRERITNPNAVLIHSRDGQVVTYSNMLDRSAQFANALAKLGVVKGDRVAAQVEKSVEAIWLYLACLRVGAVFLPLNTSYTDTELNYFVSDAEPRVFVCQQDRYEAIEALARANGVGHVETLNDDQTGSLFDKADACSKTHTDVVCDGEELAAILYTSGTTGRPKGAMLTHENLSSNSKTLVSTWKFSSSDVLLHALPIFHTHGLFVATNVTLLSGASMHFHPGFDLSAIVAALPQVTVMMGVPTFYIRLLSSDELTRELVENMRLFVSGSAPLSSDTHRQFEQRTGHTILERYGMTETNMNTSNPYDGERRAGTVGFALQGVEIRVADPETGGQLADGEIGSIEIRGSNVFKGYWRKPEKTAAEFRDDGFFISGDLGFIDEKGYLNISGRGKDLIISGGFNVYPAEVENAIDGIAGINESAVIGVPHPDFGEGVTAVVATSIENTPDAKDIKAVLTNELAGYKLPKQIFYVEALPRNKMGKVQKNVLRERYKATYNK